MHSPTSVSFVQNPLPVNNGDLMLSFYTCIQVQLCRLQDFDIAFSSAFKLGSGALYTSAVLEALIDCWKLLNPSKPTSDNSEASPPTPSPPESLESYLEWVSKSFVNEEESLLPQGKCK